jgi:hypothetical protein
MLHNTALSDLLKKALRPLLMLQNPQVRNATELLR